MGEVTPSHFYGSVQWDVALGAKAAMGPAPFGSVLRAAAEEAMAGKLCLPAALCHLWLCLSRTFALRCHLILLTEVGPGPGPSLGPYPASAEQKCKEGEVCHQTLLLVRTGPVVASFHSKGCTPPGLQSSGVSQYRQPPEVSLTLYNHVCSTDLCNSPAAALWNLSAGPAPPPSGAPPGPLRCPACAAPRSCPEDSPLAPCPPRSRCYRGVVRLESGGLFLPLALWGCGSWTNCSLLDGFWTPGPIALREACEDEAEKRTLLGHRTVQGRGARPEPGPAPRGRLAALLALWAALPYLGLSPWDLGL